VSIDPYDYVQAREDYAGDAYYQPPDDGPPDVFCPFAGDGRCPSDPPCPSPRERACTGDDDD
jgi:hypothetical protein